MPLRCPKCNEQFEINQPAEILAEELLQHANNHNQEIVYQHVDRFGISIEQSTSFEAKQEEAKLQNVSGGLLN